MTDIADRKWISHKHIEEETEKRKSLLPKNFDWQYYIDQNPDLRFVGINNKKTAIEHYLLLGMNEQRLCSKPSLMDMSKDKNFDPMFYLSEYPDVAAYYKDANLISQEEKLLHHYINFGKQEGRFKNRSDQERSLIDIERKISDTINFKNLICPTNNLECICLLTTDKEINGSQYQKFIDRLLVSTRSNNITKTIDLKIITNKKSKQNLDLSKLETIFANVELITLNLSKEEDVYISKLNPSQKLPKYGLKSGPNITFFTTIKKMKTYNTTLFLETDCFLKENWINDIYNYVKYSNGFLVSGATYDGTVFTKAGSIMMSHINGGTALYATGNKFLQKIVDILSTFLQKQVANNMPGLAYDYAFKLMLDNNLNNTFNNHEEHSIWQFINRNYLPCKLIVNCSTSLDANIDKNELIRKYNYAILHKKDTKLI
jgi:hypothetical protein